MFAFLNTNNNDNNNKTA